MTNIFKFLLTNYKKVLLLIKMRFGNCMKAKKKI